MTRAWALDVTLRVIDPLVLAITLSPLDLF